MTSCLLILLLVSAFLLLATSTRACFSFSLPPAWGPQYRMWHAARMSLESQWDWDLGLKAAISVSESGMRSSVTEPVSTVPR
jgi:hypothetical protein